MKTKDRSLTFSICVHEKNPDTKGDVRYGANFYKSDLLNCDLVLSVSFFMDFLLWVIKDIFLASITFFNHQHFCLLLEFKFDFKIMVYFFVVVYLPYIIRVETVELGTSRDAFPMSANISESKAAIQSRPPDQYNSYFC